MRSLAMRLIVLWGWRRALVALFAGSLSALSLAPYHFFPVLFLTIPTLIWLLDGVGGQEVSQGQRFKSAFVTGWCFGFGYFLAGIYWVGLAFLVDAAVFAWMMPLAVIALPMGLAFFTGVSIGVYQLLWQPNSLRILSFAILFVAGEWVRGHVLTGFPWNLIGYSMAFSDSLVQIASLVGGYGLSFFCLIALGSFALTSESAQNIFRQFIGPVFGSLVLVAIFSYGSYRLAGSEVATTPDVSLRIIQPNISQKEKWNPENRNNIIAKVLSMSNKPTSPETMGVENATHIIWPEVALPILLLKDEATLSAIAAMLPETKFLITGTIRRQEKNSTQDIKSFNSVVVLDSEARLIAKYDKSHLVPFGEYLPLANILEPLGLRKLVSIPTGFLAGPGRETLTPQGTPSFSPLICYEAIFPGSVINNQARPQWMLNVTNDAWFGDSAGPYQHFQQSRIRAIEEGLPMIRAANTGISAIIDSYGRVIASLPLNHEGVIDGKLPLPLSPTIYSKYGNLIFLIGCGLFFVFIFISRKIKFLVS